MLSSVDLVPQIRITLIFVFFSIIFSPICKFSLNRILELTQKTCDEHACFRHWTPKENQFSIFKYFKKIKTSHFDADDIQHMNIRLVLKFWAPIILYKIVILCQLKQSSFLQMLLSGLFGSQTSSTDPIANSCWLPLPALLW